MAERKTRVMHNGKMVDGFDVPVTESSERWSEFTLEDGTIIRVKVNLIAAVRIPDEFDAQGNPIYVINAGPTIGVLPTDTNLMKKG